MKLEKIKTFLAYLFTRNKLITEILYAYFSMILWNSGLDSSAMVLMISSCDVIDNFLSAKHSKRNMEEHCCTMSQTAMAQICYLVEFPNR